MKGRRIDKTKTRQTIQLILMSVTPLLLFASVLPTALADTTAKANSEEARQLMEGTRSVLGKVQVVTSGQIKVDIGEVQPRFLPLKEAQEKGFPPITEGENLIIVLNAENLIVDFHPLDTSSADHKIIRGEISENLPIGQDSVVIKSRGTEHSFAIRSQARSKVAAIPVGIAAVFLIDETNQIADGASIDHPAAKAAHQQPERLSPIKGAHSKVDGTIVSPLKSNRITIRTGNGSEKPYEVREILHQKMAGLQKGDAVILMVDKENKVIDLAVPPSTR